MARHEVVIHENTGATKESAPYLGSYIAKETVAMAAFAAVVGAGSGTFYAVKALARAKGCPSAAILYPRGYRISSFDCVMAPSFDRPAKAGNVIEIPANLVAADADFYEKGLAAFAQRHRQSKGAAAVISWSVFLRLSRNSSFWPRPIHSPQ